MKMTKMKMMSRTGYSTHIDEGSSAIKKKGGYCRTRTIKENMQARAKDDHRVILPQHRKSINKMTNTMRQYNIATSNMAPLLASDKKTPTI